MRSAHLITAVFSLLGLAAGPLAAQDNFFNAERRIDRAASDTGATRDQIAQAQGRVDEARRILDRMKANRANAGGAVSGAETPPAAPPPAVNPGYATPAGNGAPPAPAYDPQPVAQGYNPAPAAPYYPPPPAREPARLRVAVYDFDNQAPQVPDDFVIGLTEMLIAELMKQGRYQVLDRAMTKQVLYEQQFGRSAVVRRGTGPSSTANLGAQVIIKGAVTHYTAASKGSSGGFAIGGFSVGAGGKKGVLGMNIRIVDGATGEVIAVGEKTTKIKGSDMSFGYSRVTSQGRPMAFNFDNFKQTPLGDAARNLVGEIMNMLNGSVDKIRVATPTDVGFRGSVVRVDRNMVYVNGGQDKDVRVGDVYNIYRKEAELVDPESGESLGADKQSLGSIRIMKVEDKFSIGEIVSGGNFQRADLVER